jgi:glycerol dehydrogenase
MRMIAMKVPENYLQQAGVLNKVGEYVAPLARRVLIVAGGHAPWRGRRPLGHSLQREGIAFDVARLTGKCTLETVQNLARQAQEAGRRAWLALAAVP